MKFVGGDHVNKKYTELDIIDNWTGLREELVFGNGFLVRLEAMGKDPLDLEKNENFLAESAELDAAHPNLVDAEEIQAFLDKNRGSLVEESLTYQSLKSVIASKSQFSENFLLAHNLTSHTTFASRDVDFSKSYLSSLLTLRLPFSRLDLTTLHSIYASNTLRSFTKKKTQLSLELLKAYLQPTPTSAPQKTWYQFTDSQDHKLVHKKCSTIYENTTKLLEISDGILGERLELLE